MSIEIKSVRDDERISTALQRSLELGETGIAVAAYYRGRLVIDAVAGTRSHPDGDLVTRDTLFPIFSVTKGITALALHIQANRGLLDVLDPISKHWPEFSKHGKEAITIEQALSHRAGIPQMPPGVTPQLMSDWKWMTENIANSKPVFPPGQANAYHVLVWGWVIGEIVRRTDPAHRPFELFVRQEICEPLGIRDFHLGISDADIERVATLSGGNAFSITDEHGICPDAVFPGADIHNLRIMQQLVDPGAGAIANAESVARIFAVIAGRGELDGVRLLSEKRVAGLTKVREGAQDQDKVLPIPVWFGAAGFWLGGEPNASDPHVGEHRNIVYSPGAGGSIAWADLRDEIAVAICHNNMDTVAYGPERTFDPVIKAVREIISEIQ